MNLYNLVFENTWNHLAIKLIFLRQEINTLPRCKRKYAHLSRDRLIQSSLWSFFLLWIRHAFIIIFSSLFLVSCWTFPDVQLFLLKWGQVNWDTSLLYDRWYKIPVLYGWCLSSHSSLPTSHIPQDLSYYLHTDKCQMCILSPDLLFSCNASPSYLDNQRTTQSQHM